jgi:hypothetical protein
MADTKFSKTRWTGTRQEDWKPSEAMCGGARGDGFGDPSPRPTLTRSNSVGNSARPSLHGLWGSSPFPVTPGPLPASGLGVDLKLYTKPPTSGLRSTRSDLSRVPTALAPTGGPHPRLGGLFAFATTGSATWRTLSQPESPFSAYVYYRLANLTSHHFLPPM